MTGEITITVVPDEACPGCGGGYPNRPKVADEAGLWWWRCYTPYAQCRVGYYQPETSGVEYKLPPEQEAAHLAKLHAEFTERMRGMVSISRATRYGSEGRFIKIADPAAVATAVAEGWELPPLAAQLRALTEGQQLGDATCGGATWQVNLAAGCACTPTRPRPPARSNPATTTPVAGR